MCHLLSALAVVNQWKSYKGGVVNKTDFAFFDDPTNEVATYINVFGARVVLMISHECDGRLKKMIKRLWRGG